MAGVVGGRSSARIIVTELQKLVDAEYNKARLDYEKIDVLAAMRDRIAKYYNLNPPRVEESR